MSLRQSPVARFAGGIGPFYETATGHRCATWHSRGSAGLECGHGYVVLPHEAAIARLRADRVRPAEPDPAAR
jgi:hypothetical protein